MLDEVLSRIRVGEARQQGLEAQRARRLLGLQRRVARHANVEGVVIIIAVLVGVVLVVSQA